MIEISPETHAEIRAWTLAEYPKEMCGFLMKNGSFANQTNIAEAPETEFEIHPLEWIAAEKKGIRALLHSHTTDPSKPALFDPRRPSFADMSQQISMDLPWGIVACEGENVSDVLWFGTKERAPLEGRDFVSGVYDCYSLVRDWFLLERQIDLPDYPRQADWWDGSDDLLMDQYASAGFVEADYNDLQVGDGVLMSILSNKVNHCGVFVGEGELLHHLSKRLSRKEPIIRWRDYVRKVCRYAPNSDSTRQTRKGSRAKKAQA